MRMVLEVQDGAASGRKVWLLSGQTVTVGRSDAADFVLAGDPRMSSRHFQLECRGEICELRDLNSTNGTFVNGVRVRQHQLKHRDEIVAGQTRFLVAMAEQLADGPLPEPAPGTVA